MSWRRFAALGRNLFRRDSVERELDEELKSYADLLTAEKMGQGLEGIEQIKEAVRDVRTGALIESSWRDLQYGLRVLLKKPGFFAAASLTLALGIGAATTLFSVVESQLWRPLPFPQPQRLVVVFERNLKQQWQQSSDSVPEFADWRKRSHAFESLSAMRWPTQRSFVARGFSERPRVAAISAEFFHMLGVQPQLGRVFEAADEIAGHQNRVILSGAVSRRAFGLPQNALGQTVQLDGERYSVIGVLPDAFRLEVIRTPDVFFPLAIGGNQPRDARDLAVIGRLRPGETLKSGLADMEIVARGIAAEHPDTNANRSALADDLRSIAFGVSDRTSLLLYFAFSVFVLAIACANVSCLQLIRSVVRQREFAIREALGADRAALLRQAIAENAWIAIVGAALGALFAIWGTEAFQVLSLKNMLPRETEPSLDLWSIAFAVAVSMAATLLFGAAPGLVASKVDLEAALRDSARSASPGAVTKRKIEWLASAEVTLAFVSLFGAGLFWASHSALQQTPLGFSGANVLTIHIPLSGQKYADPEQVRTFYRGLMQQVSSTAGITEAAVASGLPLDRADNISFLRTDRPRPARGSEPGSLKRAVTPNYFRLLGIPVIRGRVFTDHDSESAPRVALINENFARHFFPAENPIGKELLIASATVQIIGIVANTKEVGVDEVDFDDLYLPFAQSPTSSMFAMFKASAPSSLGLVLRRKFRQLDSDQFVAEPRMLDSYVVEALRGSGAKLALILIFAGLALTLTAVALYGTLSFAVAQRTREIGVRIALGAQRTRVLGLAFRNILRLTLTGSVCGFFIAFLLGTILRNALYLAPHEHNGILYKVGIHDPLSFVSAASLLILFAVLAGLLPALRAMRIDPCETLRCE